jgi:YHS domain-containing protein
MIPGLFRIIVYGLIAYLIYLVYRFFKAISEGSKQPRINKQPSGIMVKDETCNTYLPKEDAIKMHQGGRDYFFCSQECKQKFLNSHKPQ